MKILRIIARLNVGGPAQHVTWLTAAFAADGHEAILVTGNVAAGEADMSAFAAAMGVRPIVMPEMSREISVKDAVTAWKLWRLMVRERPDVIHTHTAKAGSVGRLAAFFYRWATPGVFVGRTRLCAVVHTYHGHVFHGYYGPAKTRVFLMVERLLARLVTDRIVVLSKQQLDEIHHEFHVGRAEQFAVVPLGLDLSRFENTASQRTTYRGEIGAGADEVVVGIIGRLTEIKNHELFFRAAARVLERRSGTSPNVRFVVIGDGHLRSTLERLVRELGIERSVTFEGTRNDPQTFIAGLDLVVLTSRNEGTPLCIIEAIACARPVLSTAVGGVRDLLGAPHDLAIQPGGSHVAELGVLVPSDDIVALADAMNRLIDDAGLRETIAGRMAASGVSAWSVKRLEGDLEKLYSDILTERGR